MQFTSVRRCYSDTNEADNRSHVVTLPQHSEKGRMKVDYKVHQNCALIYRQALCPPIWTVELGDVHKAVRHCVLCGYGFTHRQQFENQFTMILTSLESF